MKTLNKLFNKIIHGDTNNWLIQLVRYVFVGGFAFLVDYGFLYALTEFFHLHYLASATISFLLGLLTNYILSTKWIFRHSKIQNKSIEFFFFAIIGIVGLVLNNLFLYMMTDGFHIHYMMSKIVVAAIVMFWNFAARKILLFKNKTN